MLLIFTDHYVLERQPVIALQRTMDSPSTVIVCVLLPFCGMYFTAYLGMFDHVQLDIGLQHYAESLWLPFCSFMPLNSLINFGYIGLGVYWYLLTQTAIKYGMLKDKDCDLFCAFNIMSMLYGFVQLLRIVTQSVLWSVLDQWSTLPFFSLLLVWGLYYQHGWSNRRAFVILSISLISYSLSLFFKAGFEITLGFHIVSAICGAIMAYKKHTSQGSLTSFWLGLLSCLGFVILKLLDHTLAEYCILFRYVSGHFLSKICDICQIHFVNNFFLDLTLQKAADISVQKQAEFFKHCETNGFYNETHDIMYEVLGRSKDT